MKFRSVKRTLLKESAIIGGVLALLGVGCYVLDDYILTYGNDKSMLQNQVNGIIGEMNVLQEKYSKVQKNAQIYNEASKKSANEGLVLNRDVMRDRFDQFKQRYHLSNIRLSIGPVRELADAKYKRGTQLIEASDVVLETEAVTDEYIYGMLQAMKNELPGFVKVTKMIVRRTVKDKDLQPVTAQGVAGFVRAEIKFTWLGIKTLKTPPANPNAPGMPGMPPGMTPPGAPPGAPPTPPMPPNVPAP